MGPLEVLFNQTHGYVQVDLLVDMQSPRKEVYQQTKRGVLISRKLDLHCPKFDPPSYFVVYGYFEPDGVPVGAIEHLKQCVVLVCHFLKLLVSQQHVPFENIGHMIDQVLVHFESVLLCLLLNIVSVSLADI